MQAGGKKKVFAGGDTVHLTFSNFEELLDLLGEETVYKHHVPQTYGIAPILLNMIYCYCYYHYHYRYQSLIALVARCYRQTESSPT